MSLQFRLTCLCLTLASAACLAQSPLQFEREIPLPAVSGRIDHLTTDIERQRVFIAALGNSTIEVVDLPTGRRVAQIKDLKEPQGLLYLAASNTLYVATGGDGSVRSFHGASLAPLRTVRLGDDADNLRYSPARGLLLAGYGSGAIALLDPDLNRKGEVALPAHPESFQLSPDGRGLFVNLPRNMSIAAADLDTLKVTANWRGLGALSNFPMTLDSEHGRLFVVCRMPARLLQIDMQTGSVMARLETAGDADDLFYDPLRKRLYVIGGAGFVDIVDVSVSNRLTSIAHQTTAPGARTGLLAPQWNKLLVAAPRRDGKEARLLVYSLPAPAD